MFKSPPDTYMPVIVSIAVTSLRPTSDLEFGTSKEQFRRG